MKKSSVENQNSNLPSEEKSSNSSQIETVSQQTKQLSITSDLPQEVNDVKQKDGEAKSPSLPSPHQPKKQPEVKSTLDENVPQSKNSSAATATSQKIELRKNLITEQPKENKDPGSELNVNETKKDILHSPSPTDQKENDYLVINMISTASSSQVISDENTTTITVQASSTVNPGQGHQRFYEPGEYYVIVPKDGNTNGGATASTVPLLRLPGDGEPRTVHKQEANCIQCSALVKEELVTEEFVILNIECKCSNTSLLHLDCKDAWLQRNGDKCSRCDKKFTVKSVTLGFSSPQTNSDNSHAPAPQTNSDNSLAPELEVTTWKRTWFCWHD
ncbi:uncharacterized protein LOC125220060 [Salvia hispanica]|uniref:uncharacterized protein LOC125220060 n=1 Tax=Salvia hispanica TaxID=49212 RepID=UPI002008F2D6|nr:uncharacterized protein LOC125220060 [Salvia hispanica]